eukprot:g8476.t1
MASTLRCLPKPPEAAAVVLLGATGYKVHSGEGSSSLSFEDFLQLHGRSYDSQEPSGIQLRARKRSKEYLERQALFEQRKAEVIQQNNRSAARWRAAVNKFADFRDEEREALHGYKPSQERGKGLSFAAKDLYHSNLKLALPDKVDWRHLKDAQEIVDQGACGSCWAVSATTVLNAHSEIHRKRVRRFSTQEMINCVPNPQECGGQGGCQGATVELGIAWAQLPYTAADGHCQKTSFLENKGLRGSVMGGASFGLAGFHVLPSNKEEPLARALAELGPVAVSVAANNWFNYYNGVFDDCDNIVNHAVTLYGYGKQGADKYWLVKNSWGPDWGENGFIRILRHSSEDTFCGMDTDPSKGVACKGGPKEVEVCGTCGILYDSVVPRFEDSKDA